MESMISFPMEGFKESPERMTAMMDYYAFLMRNVFKLELKGVDEGIGVGWKEKCSLSYKWVVVNNDLNVNEPVETRYDLLVATIDDQRRDVRLGASIFQCDGAFKAYQYIADRQALQHAADFESLEDAKNVLEILVLAGGK